MVLYRSLSNLEYAAAFFLLADKLSDAVNVCVKNLEDIQLAILIIRIYEGSLLNNNMQVTVPRYCHP